MTIQGVRPRPHQDGHVRERFVPEDNTEMPDVLDGPSSNRLQTHSTEVPRVAGDSLDAKTGVFSAARQHVSSSRCSPSNATFPVMIDSNGDGGKTIALMAHQACIPDC